jgi:NitT/TauT family transport system substrate-binding protein
MDETPPLPAVSADPPPRPFSGVSLVDCCAVAEGERTFQPGVSPYAIHPDPRLRPISRRRVLRRASMLGAVAFATACAKEADPPAAAESPGPGAGPTSSASSTPTQGTATQAAGNLETIELPYCSQILCGVPLETAVRRGFFEEEGLRVKLVYMKGGALTVQALLGNSVDFVGAAMDVVVSAAAAGKEPLMIASLSSLPFFALVTAPDSTITDVAGLKGKRIAVANLNTSDHLLARYLLQKNGVDDSDAAFAPLGPNLFDGLRKKQVDAGLVQEPALSKLEQLGCKVLVNFMKREDAQKYLGGDYQFFGLNTRPDVIAKRPETLRKLVRALTKANEWVRANPGSEIVKNLPEDLVTGDDVAVFAARLDAVKNDLYPASLRVDTAAVQRVIDVQKAAGALESDVAADKVFRNDFVAT